MAPWHSNALIEEAPFSAVQFHGDPLTHTWHGHHMPLTVWDIVVVQDNILLPTAQVVMESDLLVFNLWKENIGNGQKLFVNSLVSLFIGGMI